MNNLEVELRKLIRKPKITLGDFDKLIPLLTSSDKDIVRLGVECLKTYDYGDLQYTCGTISAYSHIPMSEFELYLESSTLDEYCNSHLSRAYLDIFLENYKR